MFLHPGLYDRLDPGGIHLNTVVRVEELIDEFLPPAVGAWLDAQDPLIKIAAFRLLTQTPAMFVRILWELRLIQPDRLPDAANVPACASLLRQLAGYDSPRHELPEKAAEVTVWDDNGGDLSLGHLNISRDQLKMLSGALSSPSAKGRHNASKTIRGKDSVFSPLQTLVHAQWVIDNRFAIQKLAYAVSGCEAIFSLERGGSLVADHIMGHLRDSTRNVKVPKVLERNAKYSKDDHIARFKQAVREHIGLATPNRAVTIGVTETIVGGSSANTILNALNSLVRQHPNLSVRFLFSRHTFHRDDEHVKLFEQLPLVPKPYKREMYPGEFLNVPAFPGQAIAFISKARYIIGEDVGYQLDYDGPSANEPLVVFNMVGQQLRALSIQPSGGHTAREMIVRLVLGAYDDLLREAGLL